MKNLAQLRKAANLSQRALADKLNVSQPTIAGWEAGAHKPRPSRWRRMALALESDILTMVRMWT